MIFQTEVCSVAKTSKISLPHHISFTKNGSQKEKKQDLLEICFKIVSSFYLVTSGLVEDENV
jgi:hypothetical protein